MSKWIVDVHGELEGDYELIGKYEEPKTGMTLREFRRNFIDGPTNVIIEIQYFGQLMLTEFQHIHESLLDRKVVEVTAGDCQFSDTTENYLIVVLEDED